MNDASAKLTSGVLHGNIHQYGNFDECLRSDASGGKFRGQYCLVNINLDIPEHTQQLKPLKQALVFQEEFKSTFRDVSHR